MSPAISVPSSRITACNRAPVRADGDYILYWMIAARRTRWNFALDRAVQWAADLKRPLLILEALRCDYPWASARHHRFVLDGMADNAESFRRASVAYYPYVEPAAGAGRGLLAALAARACVVVTDEFPCFFLPHMVAAAVRRLPVRIEQVDSNGLLPLRAAEKVFSTAHSFRRFLQKTLPQHLEEFPQANPLARPRLPRLRKSLASIEGRWPPATRKLLTGEARALAELPVDQSVIAAPWRGGSVAAQAQLRRFLCDGLRKYEALRNQPEAEVTSGLSPYLHFGHISVHQVFRELMAAEGWKPEAMALRATGSRSGWWGCSAAGEAFLDQLVTWRELGFNFCARGRGYDRYDSLPAWARKTLAAHARDEREYVYSLSEFERARTHDPLWNAAQTQLVREGRMHNYLRMLWGKKILEWTRSPRVALRVMLELNNKYALDGRDPNSYSGIFWCLGRYDRPWGPERPVFGTVRYMSSQNTARKVRVRDYVARYAPVEVVPKRGSGGRGGRRRTADRK